MKKWKTARANPVVKVGLFLAGMAVAAAAFWCVVVTGANWDDLWSGADYFASDTAREVCQIDVEWVYDLQVLRQRQQRTGELSYLEKEQMRALETALDSTQTNFRYEIHSADGELLDTNLKDDLFSESVYFGGWLTSFPITFGTQYRSGDRLSYDADTERRMLLAYTGEGYQRLDPADWKYKNCPYGYYSDGESFYGYDSDLDQRVTRVELAMRYGIASPMAVEDKYAQSEREYASLQGYIPAVAGAAVVLCIAALVLMGLLCSSAGRRENGQVVMGWQEKVPYDLYLAVQFCAWVLVIGAGTEILSAFNRGNPRAAVPIALGVVTLLGCALALGLLMTTAVRVKRRRLLRDTLIVRFFRMLGRAVRRMVRSWPVTRRTVGLFLLYLAGSAVTLPTVILVPVYQGFVLWCICRWTRQWSAIREGTGRIIGGDADYKIETEKMYRTLREHAEQLNDLGGAIGSAVDERLRSERMKAELITNVSHDLKTPLTSIITYVDLLKKTGLTDPKALECVEVLERKSQRLKKLTEDLVEASKASTGNLTVTPERLGMVQLVSQALGEYQEKFAQKSLEVVTTLPEEECWVMADGQHLWRVIDNLLSNCWKYAMPRTRIYLEVKRWEGRVVFSVKNVSQQALNVPPEQLMERFVRGDESRTTEGSGLGLSIARSLTELQGGGFHLGIDGDLFKAAVSFDEDIEPIPLPPAPESGEGEDGR